MSRGLYAKALRGEIAEFTGVSAPYDRPEHAELALDAAATSPADGAAAIDALLAPRLEPRWDDAESLDDGGGI